MAEEERPEEEPEKIEIEEVAEAKPVRASVTPVIRRRKPWPVRPARRVAEPVKEMTKKPSPKTVKGKIAAIQKTAGMIYSGARAIQAGINEQMKENLEAVAAMQSGINGLQADIKDHMKKHQDAVAAMQSAISGQMNENQTYVRNFYG